MNRAMREVTSSGVGLAGLVATAALGAPVALVLSAPILLYVGCRLLIPVPPDKTEIILPGDITEAERDEFIDIIRRPQNRIKELALRLPQNLRDIANEFVKVIDDIIAVFMTDPKDIRLARPFPDRVKSLSDMLEEYARIYPFQDRSEKTKSAVKNIETVLPQILEQFKTLHGRLLDNDAGALSVDVKTLEQLMKLD